MQSAASFPCSATRLLLGIAVIWMGYPQGPATCTAGRAWCPEYFGSLPIKASPKVHTCTLSECFPEILCLVGIFLKCTLFLQSLLILRGKCKQFCNIYTLGSLGDIQQTLLWLFIHVPQEQTWSPPVCRFGYKILLDQPSGKRMLWFVKLERKCLSGQH